MALDRWIALILLGICLAYGYAAWFTMDAGLAPFMQRNPIWPSTFPKALSVLGAGAALVTLFGLEKSDVKMGDIDYRRLHRAAGPHGYLRTNIAPLWVFGRDIGLSDYRCVYLGRAQIACDDPRRGDRRVLGLVSGVPSVGNLHAPSAGLFTWVGGLIDA